MKKYLREGYVEPKLICKKKPKKITKEDDRKLYSIYEYDIYGELEKILSYDKSAIEEIIVENSYNDKGQLLSKDSYNNGKVIGKLSYEYRENGLVSRSKLMSNSLGESYYDDKFDKFGRIFYKHRAYIGDQEDNYKEYTEYYYDDLIKKDSKRWVNDKDKIKKRERYGEGPQGYKLVFEERNDYDADGELIKCFKENKTYYGDIEKRKKEEVVVDESKRKEIIKEIKDKCKGFMEKGGNYKEEELVVKEVSKIYSAWYEDSYEEVGIPHPRFKIRDIVISEPGKWDRKDYELEVGYVLKEGYKVIRSVGKNKEEIRLLNLYEYDIEKKEKGKVFREQIEKRVHDSKERRVEWLYEITYKSKYDIIKKRYDGENQVEEIFERRRYNKYKRELGRLLERERKADVNKLNGDDETPLHIALKLASETKEKGAIDKMIKSLLKGFKDVQIADKDGNNCIHLAAAAKGVKLEMIINRPEELDLEKRNSLGESPLFIASAYGNRSAVGTLLDEKVDVESKNNLGETPLYIASKNNHKDVVEILLEKDGVDIDGKANDGTTPLWAACSEGNEEIVKLLFGKGANDSFRQEDNVSAVEIAQKNGHEKIVELLEGKG